MGLYNNVVNRLSEWYFSKKALPFWIVLLMDCLIVLVSYLVSFFIVSRPLATAANAWPLIRTLLLYLILYIVSFRIFHTYRGVIRYSSFVDLKRIALSGVIASAAVWIINLIADLCGFTFLFHLRDVCIFSACLSSIVLMWGVRVLVKLLYDGFLAGEASNVLVYGVLDGGIALAKNIRSEKPLKYRLCGFISHDPSSKLDYLLGEKVYLPNEDLIKVFKDKNIRAVLVPVNRCAEMRDDETLHNLIIDNGVKILMEQSLEDSEDRSGVQLKEIRIEDLLPREQIQVDMDSVKAELEGKVIMITGSAGSIGSEIVRQVAQCFPKEMVLVDQAETPQHDIRLMMANEYPQVKAHTLMTSIDSRERMRVIFNRYRPDYVFHAAAYKHVPMMEDNPSAAVHNNIRGTMNVADLAREYHAKKFVMVSTDKAVNPTNVMGCSKRICEIYVQSLNKAEQEGKIEGETQYVTTRFGNVLGSNGSVIPLFKKQIAEGGPVTVTHKDIIRYFMLIPEACKLVLEAGTRGKGGEIFVFDMGKPVRIADLAKRMILLSGADNVEIKYTGLREGEKLYEEVLNVEETTKPSFHEKIRIASVREYDYEDVKKQILDLIYIAGRYNEMDIVAKMKEIVPEYKSKNSVYEVLDKN
ncbi:MAG: polysaccharide biosynthesis protein [Candidatus Cryptobacteroides sp.]